jgi:hypothetical protein
MIILGVLPTIARRVHDTTTVWWRSVEGRESITIVNFPLYNPGGNPAL